ncbi:MAG: HD domain-containing protein [Bacteroidota bacterium]
MSKEQMEREYVRAIGLVARAHAFQRYGDYPYIHHLMAVERVLGIFNMHPFSNEKQRKLPVGVCHELRLACLLHDTLEDTFVTLESLEEDFGVAVAGLVYCVTNDPVPDSVTDKAERRALKFKGVYEKLKSNWKALVVKLCDRIANVESCLNYRLTKDRQKAFDKLEMYVNEYECFRAHLFDPQMSETKSLWKHLDFRISEGKALLYAHRPQD